MKYAMLFGCVMLAVQSPVWAIESGSSSAAQKQTETWLQLQVKGDAASKKPQTATPAEREMSLQRWLDNGKHDIPEFFTQEQGGKIGGGSGGK